MRTSAFEAVVQFLPNKDSFPTNPGADSRQPPEPLGVRLGARSQFLP